MNKMTELLNTFKDNLTFVIGCALIGAALIGAAWLVEHIFHKNIRKVGVAKRCAYIGVFSAISAVLMLFEMPVPFAPAFYKLDFSELPALIAAFAFGPVAGVMTEFCKILLKLLFKSTSTAFVGELANFVVGCSFLLPASIIYLFKKSKKQAVISCIIGTACMTVFGTAFNGIYLLPKFAQLYGMPLEAIIEMGTIINPAITDITSLVVMAVAPLNILKGSLVSIITLFIYKKLSVIIKSGN